MPKAKKESVGFAIALSADNQQQSKIIKADFIQTIINLLSQSNLSQSFEVVIIPDYYAQKIIDFDSAFEVLTKSRSKFMIYGRARMRILKGEPNNILDLNGIVAHSTFPPSIKRSLQAEFTELFPRRLIVGEDDMFAFEISAEFLSVTAKYIIGVTAQLSSDTEYALQLFHEVKSYASQSKVNVPSIVKIRNRIDRRLFGSYVISARVLYHEWRKTKENETMQKMFGALTNALQYKKKHYDLNMLLSIAEFVINKNIDEAIRLIFQVKNDDQYIWSLNLGFLFTYKGEMEKACKHYRIAFKHGVSNDALFQTEEFINWVLDSNPELYQLHFALGLINLQGKEDYITAQSEFTEFVASNVGKEYEPYIQKAQSHLALIKRRISVEN